MSVVELVGRDQVAHRPQRVDLFSQPFVRLRGGPQEEASAGESDYNHAGRDRHRAAREGQLDMGSVDRPEVLAHRLEGVYGFVELHGQSLLRHNLKGSGRSSIRSTGAEGRRALASTGAR